jgi:type IV pilus assembly protein PilQ
LGPNTQLGFAPGSGNNAVSAYNSGSSSSAGSSNWSNFVNLPAGGSNFNATFALFSYASGRLLTLELQAAESEGRAKTVSSPRIITSDQKAASIQQGLQIPYQQATSSGATSVAYKNAVLSLDVTPQITPDGNVILEVKVNKDSLSTNSTTAGPAINTKSINTEVLVENGGTVVIGGIFEETVTDSVNKVPLLGDLPVIGRLFRANSKIATRSEMLVFLSPRIVSERAIVR